MRKRIKNAAMTPSGTALRVHPLTWCVQHQLGNRPKSDAAHMLCITPQSLYILLGKCRAHKDTRVPAAWARPLARFFGVPPAFLRPDLYAAHWTEKELM